MKLGQLIFQDDFLFHVISQCKRPQLMLFRLPLTAKRCAGYEVNTVLDTALFLYITGLPNQLSKTDKVKRRAHLNKIYLFNFAPTRVGGEF